MVSMKNVLMAGASALFMVLPGVVQAEEAIVAKHTGRSKFNAPAKMIELIKAKDYGR